MALHSQIRDQLKRVEQDWPQFPHFPARVAATISDFCQNGGKRDGRGLKVAARNEVLRTLKHVRSAERKATQAAAAPSLAKEARKFLKFLGHNDEFERTVARARCFVGEMQRTGRRIAMARPVCEPMERHCGTVDGVPMCARRVTSVAELMRVGRALDLCVAKRDAVARDYHAQLKSGETEFWCLEAADRSVALLRSFAKINCPK